MDSTLLGGAALVALVVVLGLVMRRTAGGDAASRAAAPPEDAVSEGASPASERDAVDELLDEVSEGTPDLAADDDAVVAMTSDGSALVADRHAVRLVPPETDDEAAWRRQDPAARARDRRGDYAMTASWHAGDLTGARVTRGEAGEAPWRLDALGRDGEYTAMLFETESGARAALELFTSKGIVRAGRGEDGDPVPPSAEQFDEARRIYLETIAELESGDAGEGDR